MIQEGIEAKMRQGDWEGAMVACQSALQVQPTNPKLLAYLGLCQFRKADYAAAELSFRRATLLDPNFLDAGIKHAQCLDKLRRYEEAYVVAQEWLRKKPGERTLTGLIEFLRLQVNGERQGWERTMGLNRNVTIASE